MLTMKDIHDRCETVTVIEDGKKKVIELVKS